MTRHTHTPPDSTAGLPESTLRAPDSTQRLLVFLLLLVGLALVPYVQVLQNELAFDSRFIAQSDRVQDLSKVREIFSTEYWNVPDVPSRLYRPLTLLSIALVSATVGNTPAAQHAMNGLLHGLDVLLLFALVLVFCRRLQIPETRSWVAAGATAVLAAVHPVRSEAVIDIVGRGELLAFGFGMVALLAVLSARRWVLYLAPLAAAAAVLSKESGLIIPVFGALLLLAVDGRITRSVVVRSLSLLLGVAVAVGIREAVLHDTPIPTIEFGDNALAIEGYPARFLTGAAIAWKYLQLHLWPATLSPDYSYNSIHVRTGLDTSALLGLVAIAGSIAAWLWSLRRGPMARATGAALGCLAFGLVAIDNQFVLLGTMLGERLTYLATWGVLLAVGLVAARFWDRRRTMVLGLGFLAVGSMAVRTWVRVPEWKNQLELFQAATRAQPESFRVWAGLGEALLREGRFRESLACFERSASIHPGYANNWSLWLSALVELESWDEVPRILSGLKIVRPDDVVGYYAEARLHLRAGQLHDALAVAEAGRQRHPGYLPLTRVGAEAAEESGDDARAMELYQELVGSTSSSEADRARLAFLQQENERWVEAEANYAILYAQRGDWYNGNGLAWSKRGRALVTADSAQATSLLLDALSLTEQAIEIAPADNKRFVQDTRAKVLEALGRSSEAMEIYRELAAAHPENDAYATELERLRGRSAER